MLKTNKAYSRKLGQDSILARQSTFYEKKSIFYEKGHFLKKIPTFPPYSIPFLNVLYQNKSLHIFPKRGQHSILKRYIRLKYALTKYNLKDFNKFI